MSIPEEFKNELLERVSLAEVIGGRLNWDSRKSQPAKGDYWACCPFHGEKTPSFHVDDRKGYYYCFGCHEKGNAISFLRNFHNLGYREAVESLAATVGMKVPAISRLAQEKADRASAIYAVCEQASQYFQQILRSDAGRGTRNYLAERGVLERTQQRFEIGFAPMAGGDLVAHLGRHGFTEQQMLDAGLVAKSERDNSLFCRFRNRLIFPIKNTRGRTIAFGGRAMGAETTAKYLNSPETEIFSKGSCLYNHGPARDACRGQEALLVVEGYMDVVSLQQAGIETCVAPLGTAVTESQLHHLWKMSPRPVLALDGDVAGMRAAERVARLALPLLKPGNSLNFCLMPEGSDPDDIVRQQGVDGIRTMVRKAEPLVEFLWRVESALRDLSTPESRAEFETALMRSVSTIKDSTVRRYYREHVRKRLGSGSTESGRGRGEARRTQRASNRHEALEPTSELRNSPLAKAESDPQMTRDLRERFVLGICLSLPEVVEDCLDALEGLELESDGNRSVLNSIIGHFEMGTAEPGGFRDAVASDVGETVVRGILNLERVKNAPIVKDVGLDPVARRENAKVALIEEIRKLETAKGASMELSSARNELADDEGGNPTARIAVAVSDRERAKKGIDNSESGEFVLAANGVRISNDELREFSAACDGQANEQVR